MGWNPPRHQCWCGCIQRGGAGGGLSEVRYLLLLPMGLLPVKGLIQVLSSFQHLPYLNLCLGNFPLPCKPLLSQHPGMEKFSPCTAMSGEVLLQRTGFVTACSIPFLLDPGTVASTTVFPSFHSCGTPSASLLDACLTGMWVSGLVLWSRCASLSAVIPQAGFFQTRAGLRSALKYVPLS